MEYVHTETLLNTKYRNGQLTESWTWVGSTHESGWVGHRAVTVMKHNFPIIGYLQCEFSSPELTTGIHKDEILKNTEKGGKLCRSAGRPERFQLHVASPTDPFTRDSALDPAGGYTSYSRHQLCSRLACRPSPFPKF